MIIEAHRENLINLYAKDNKEQMRVWSIWNEGCTIVIEHGVFGGETQRTTEDVMYGLATRTVHEQIESRINSRVNKKLDSGYVKSLEFAKNNERKNSLGFEKPMLAQPFEKIKNFEFNKIFAQPKLDGHRCLITNVLGKNIAYSRNGKRFTAIDHIVDEIVIPEGVTIDGELYCHGQTLQKISSWSKKLQPETLNLKYYCYDLISNDPYEERINQIMDIKFGSHSTFIDTQVFIGAFDIPGLMEAYRSEGFEGLMLRTADGVYETGKRSKNLIKVKKWFDDEFLVIDIIESVEGWARLVCQGEEGEVFTVSAPGTKQDKLEVMRCKESFIGKHIRIQYANLTKDNKPFHPVALDWREKAEE